MGMLTGLEVALSPFFDLIYSAFEGIIFSLIKLIYVSTLDIYF
jgi:hypothetical protein